MDEKFLPSPASRSPGYSRRRAPSLRALSWFLGTGVGLLLLLRSLGSSGLDKLIPSCAKHHHHRHRPPHHGHKGVKRTPNATISWLPCPDQPALFCSSFVVPLNPLEPVKGDDADIVLRMYPAEKGKRQGSMLVNPGGPGGSGHLLIATMGPALATIVEGRYDIVG